jgi:biopolymer transport protein ExbB/TolQ
MEAKSPSWGSIFENLSHPFILSACGLMVGIVAMSLRHYLLAQAKRFDLEMECESLHMLNALSLVPIPK